MDLLNKRYPVLHGLPCHAVRARSGELPLVEAAITKFSISDEIVDARHYYDVETTVVVSLVKITEDGMKEIRHCYRKEPAEELAGLHLVRVDDGRNIVETYDGSLDLSFHHIDILVEE